MIEQAADHGWEIVPSKCGGFVGALKGTEIHVEFKRRGVLSRRVVREFLGPLLAREGFLTTRVQVEDEVNARFVERIGFRRTWVDNEFTYYMLTAEPFARKEH